MKAEMRNERTNERARAVPTSPVTAAIAALELERENLAVRLQKVDAAIVSMRKLFHLPKPNGHAKPQARKAKAPQASRTNGRVSIDVDAVRKALRNGPVAPGVLAEVLGMERATLRYQLAKLEEQGIVTLSGTTASRRIALADDSAKEAP